jgi:hypothetical protein
MRSILAHGNELSVKTRRGRFSRPLACCLFGAYFFFAAFFAGFLAAFLAAFFVAMVFYSPFFDVTSSLQHNVAVNECIEVSK